MLHASFIMEQHLGHYTYYQNLRRFVDTSAEIHATWVPVTYTPSNGLLKRLPMLPENVRRTLCGRMQVRDSLMHTSSDVVFFNTQVPAALGGNLTRRQSYVIATDITPIQYDRLSSRYGHRPDRQGLLKSYKHHVNTTILRGAARLFPWSNWVRESLMADYGVMPQRIEVLPPGVDLTYWTPGPKRQQQTCRILFVGGDFYRKGGELLLRAFQSLPSGTAELILVTRSQVPRIDGVRTYHELQPNSPALRTLFQTCDVFVLPTEAEAFGIAAVEASAVGLPVIATAVGGLPDIVADRASGFLISPGDENALVECLHMLLQNPEERERMGKAARARAETYFDARRNAQRLVERLHDVSLAAIEGFYAA